MDQWEQSVILRFGRFNRVAGPGFHWTIPFVKYALKRSVVTTTTALRPQSVVTLDGKVVTSEAVVRWRVSDVKTFTLDVWDGTNVIIDSTQGAIANALRAVNSDDPELPKKILSESRKALTKYGIAVEAVTLTALAPVRVIRLIGAQPAPEETSNI